MLKIRLFFETIYIIVYQSQGTTYFDVFLYKAFM